VREELGIARFEVDALNHEPDAASRKRPDQSERMKQKHEAGEHDAWFRGEVEKSLARADSGEAQWFSHETVMSKLDARIARLKGTGA
jgi:hypothetical protein